MAEKTGINGKAVPMEDYGSLGKAEDKVHIMGDQDETVSTCKGQGFISPDNYSVGVTATSTWSWV